jgi:BASS family bile acid:Na+ symporter
VGFFANLFWGNNANFKKAQAVMPAFSVLGLACIVGGVISAVHDKLMTEGIMFFMLVFAVVLCHNSLGYLTGYSVGKLFNFSKAKKRTISIEVGMQNAGLATVLASTFFAISCPLAVIPCAVSCAWHSISGTILASWFRSRDKDN